MRRYRVIHPKELNDELIARWDQFQRGDSSLSNPYFRPEFSIAVGRVRDDARVTVIEDSGAVIGFFPFQKRRWGRGVPIGGPLSDYHGVIGAEGASFDPADLVRASGLSVWEFNHLPAGQRALRNVNGASAASAVMDLSSGYEAYVAERREAGSEQIKKNAGLARKLEREHGEILFEARTVDEVGLRTLMTWKSAQYVESGTVDVFSVTWTKDLLAGLMRTETPAFAGMFSTLRVGGRLIAAHMGMRSGTVWHYWFPSYDHEFRKYSPGLILLLRMAGVANDLKLGAIDLGRGEASYKARLGNMSVPLLEGRIERGGLTTSLRRARRGAEAWATRGGAKSIVALPFRVLRRIERKRKFA